MTEIRKAAVLGSGVMGGGIAAQIANAGIPVLLLDIVPKDATNRNQIAEAAIGRLLKTEPAAFMHPRNAKLVTPGNLEDHLPLLAECDWIVEVVLEDLAVKHALYEKVEKHRKDGSIVSSNTSTIPLAQLTGGMPERFQRDFLITHFFNPPRYMRLLEIVRGSKTRADAVAAVETFGDVNLGKGVVRCKDTPGFIGNRIGVFGMQTAAIAAFDVGVTVEEADAVMGQPFGLPNTGVFGLFDLIGLDLMPHVANSLLHNLKPDDPFVVTFREMPLIAKMIADGYTGRKGKGGFYRMAKTAAGRVKEAVDLKTGEYRVSQPAQLESLSAGRKDPGALLQHPDRGGEYARRAMLPMFAYTAWCVPEIADDIVGIDEAMRLGYGWKYGPFELIDRIGVDRVIAGLEQLKLSVPPLLQKAKGKSFYRVTGGALEYLTVDGAYAKVERRPGVLLLADIKRGSKPILKNASASLWDIGDGVVCLEFHTKSNALDGDVIALLVKSLDLVKRSYKALVIYNDGNEFSVGANIGLALYAANLALWPVIEEGQAAGQAALKAMRYAGFPVVAAPAGMALGGGCEILLHASAVQAYAETYMGLVETGVGLVPGWGGCTQMITRHTLNPKRPGGPIPPLSAAFETVALARVSKSAAEARDMLMLREGDGITMNRDRLLADAKAKALDLAKNYQPPKPQPLNLPGPTGAAALGLALHDLHRQGKATDYDVVVAGKLAGVLSGGDTDMTQEITEDQLMALERAAFQSLVREKRTLARVEHMLETGKPLRN